MSGSVSVDRATWELHQRALKLLNKMADDPNEGIAFKKMAKKIDGTLQFTDLDIAERVQAPVMEKLTAAEARIAAMEAEREAEKVDRETQKHVTSLTADVDKAAKAFGLTEEGRAKMTARMQEKGSLDADAAAAWVAAQAPRAKPSEGTGAFAPTSAGLFGSAEKDDSLAALHNDPIRWMEDETRKILAEPEAA
jgi:hypothetical protein